jgi:2TM domain
MEGTPDSEQELRKLAVSRLRKKRDFRTHIVIYVIVNAMLVGIWAVTGAGFFWPIFPILGWGIGVAANAWDVYGRRPITEEEIRREAERLRR